MSFRPTKPHPAPSSVYFLLCTKYSCLRDCSPCVLSTLIRSSFCTMKNTPSS
jgi:hypothetical protein